MKEEKRRESPDILSKSSCAMTHNFALADQLGVEFAAVEREVNVEINAVEGSLWRVHSLKVFLKVFP